MRKVFVIGKNQIFASVSIGIASSVSKRPINSQLLIQNADTAMYRAKFNQPGSFVIFNETMNIQVIKNLQLENDLRRAIKRNEFVLKYQPIKLLETEKVVSFEALIRWNHPSLGLLEPAVFIELAEETGLILEIDHWVLVNACNQIKIFQKLTHREIRVSINLSPLNLSQKGFLNKIQTILRKNGLTGKNLELEITERSVLNNFETTNQLLHSLRQIGIRISIDDFGTGFSSLMYLKKLEIDTLKIDRQFLPDPVNPSSGGEITTAIIQLAHILNLKVVAEGVENLSQVNFLKQNNCDMVQGFYYSRPMFMEELGKL